MQLLLSNWTVHIRGSLRSLRSRSRSRKSKVPLHQRAPVNCTSDVRHAHPRLRLKIGCGLNKITERLAIKIKNKYIHDIILMNKIKICIYIKIIISINRNPCSEMFFILKSNQKERKIDEKTYLIETKCEEAHHHFQFEHAWISCLCGRTPPCSI